MESSISMTKLEAFEWVEVQEGLTITIGKNNSINLVYPHLYDITGEDLVDAVVKLQAAIRTRASLITKDTCSTGG